ncbi:hypervirulence associated TUDOR domain-containing protein [Dermatobacter hominis]|uniref:DUF2945 domain-containing protein n=1 Tax=Dermatobacter hominis TaxID=2884263 RepID=UPI001D1235EE|nr:DUF2945 domain-containing protein [Dermatobacter hominis]UDY35116.1 DUF2945 domain-containing protein [Dermatobacter hominis]
MTAPKELSAGDRVSWDTSQGRTTGVVVRLLTSPTDIKGHHVAADPSAPQYLVRSERSGEEAAHHRSALRKLASRR